MADFTIAICSWNAGNEAPNNGTTGAIGDALVDGGEPDIIAITQQEAKEPYLHDELLKGKLKGKYSLVKDDTFWGITKLKEGITHLSNAVLVKASLAGEIKKPAAKAAKDWGKCKGGICVAFGFKGKTFGVAGCHLDASDAKKRDAEIDNIQKAFADMKCDYMLLGGDLNYRIPVVKGVVEENVTVGDICAKLIDPKQRLELFTKTDTLAKAGWVAKHGYRFPPIISGKTKAAIYPTYKKHDNAKATSVVKTNDLDECVKAFFGDATKDAKAVSAKRKGELDCGWLDRVGYKLANGAGFKLKGFEDVPSVAQSDHTPVILKGVVTIG